MVKVSRSVALLVASVGLIAMVVLQVQAKHRQPGSCEMMPEQCCATFQLSMLTDPTGWESDTGCTLRCCEEMAANRAMALKKAVLRGPIQDLAGCVARIIENISELKTELPGICCKVPFVRLLPACP